jgi:hypothetical protein
MFHSGLFLGPLISFVLGEEKDGRLVGFNEKLKLVIKIFDQEEIFSQEFQVYKVLSENHCPFVPRFYGSFANHLIGLSAILISYEDKEVEGYLSQADR